MGNTIKYDKKFKRILTLLSLIDAHPEVVKVNIKALADKLQLSDKGYRLLRIAWDESRDFIKFRRISSLSDEEIATNCIKRLSVLLGSAITYEQPNDDFVDL